MIGQQLIAALGRFFLAGQRFRGQAVGFSRIQGALLGTLQQHHRLTLVIRGQLFLIFPVLAHADSNRLHFRQALHCPGEIFLEIADPLLGHFDGVLQLIDHRMGLSLHHFENS